MSHINEQFPIQKVPWSTLIIQQMSALITAVNHGDYDSLETMMAALYAYLIPDIRKMVFDPTAEMEKRAQDWTGKYSWERLPFRYERMRLTEYVLQKIVPLDLRDNYLASRRNLIAKDVALDFMRAVVDALDKKHLFIYWIGGLPMAKEEVE